MRTSTELADSLLDDPYLTERDDLSKLPLPACAKAYARRTSKSLGKQPQQWMHVQNTLLNRGLKDRGFPTRDVVHKVPHAMKF